MIEYVDNRGFIVMSSACVGINFTQMTSTQNVIKQVEIVIFKFPCITTPILI